MSAATNEPLAARFEALLKAHGPALQRLARAYEADEHRRTDLSQEILASLWAALPAFEGRSSLRTWTFRVAHNTAISHVVRARRLQPALCTLEELPAELDLEAALHLKTQLAKLEALLHQLRPADRALMLLYLEGLTAPEIGEVTGLTSSNVSVKVHRIKAVLKQRFEEGEPR